MNSSAEELRFHLNSYGYLPVWAEYSSYASFAAMTAVAALTFAYVPGWMSVFVLASAVVGSLLVLLSIRGLRVRHANFVTLGATSFEVVFFFCFTSIRFSVPYSQVGGVLDVSSKPFFVNPWPYPMRAWGGHTEVRLASPMRTSIWRRFPPLVDVIDLDTERGDELRRELRGRAGLGLASDE